MQKHNRSNCWQRGGNPLKTQRQNHWRRIQNRTAHFPNIHNVVSEPPNVPRMFGIPRGDTTAGLEKDSSVTHNHNTTYHTHWTHIHKHTLAMFPSMAFLAKRRFIASDGWKGHMSINFLKWGHSLFLAHQIHIDTSNVSYNICKPSLSRIFF